MKAKNYLKVIFLLPFAVLFSSIAVAQDANSSDSPVVEAQRPAMKQIRDRRIDLLHRLGLTEEQLRQIRKVHQEKKTLMDDAQKRFREASRSLNEAIYADQISEADVQTRLSDLQLAQAEVEKLRYMNEFAVRRILTQEQLIRFRELRQRFENMREELKTSRQFNPDRPINRRHPENPRNAQPFTLKGRQRQEL